MRINFLGGGSDCPPFSAEVGGAVVNAGISRFVYATVETGTQGVRIFSNDYNCEVTASDVDALSFDGNLDLLKACLKRCDLRTDFTLTTESNVPVGSGLGASGALTVAVLAALRRATNASINPPELADLAFVIERQDLGYPGGSQDQYGAAFGGINYLTFKDPHVGVEQLWGRFCQNAILQHSTIFELEKNSLLIYVGESHVSGNIHSDIRSAYALANSPTKRAMGELKRLANLGREALLRGDLKVFAQLLNENWRWHKELHPSCTNKNLEEVYALALSNGAIGGATCGAGGGGCVVLICEDQKRHALAKFLGTQGYQIIDFVFNFDGVQVWEGLE